MADERIVMVCDDKIKNKKHIRAVYLKQPGNLQLKSVLSVVSECVTDLHETVEILLNTNREQHVILGHVLTEIKCYKVIQLDGLW